MTALECAFALLKCSPIGNPENSSEYGRVAYILSEHCQGKEDVSEAAMRIFAERIEHLERERDDIGEYGTEEINAAVELRQKLAQALIERDEARAIAYDLATIASHCLGWHDHETGDAAERIASVLRRWKDAK